MGDLMPDGSLIHHLTAYGHSLQFSVTVKSREAPNWSATEQYTFHKIKCAGCMA